MEKTDDKLRKFSRHNNEWDDEANAQNKLYLTNY